MVDSVYNLELYKIPSVEILHHRQVFTNLQRQFDESIDRWLKRVQHYINFCEYPTIIMEFLCIDRFTCGLNVSEIEALQKASQCWTLKLLLEHQSDENPNTGRFETGPIIDQNIHQSESIAPNMLMESEPVCLILYIVSYESIFNFHHEFPFIYFRTKRNAHKSMHFMELQTESSRLLKWNRIFLGMEFLRRKIYLTILKEQTMALD